MRLRFVLLLPIVFLHACIPAGAEDQHARVRYQRDGTEGAVSGRVIARDEQGGLCVQSDEGELFLIQADEVSETSDIATPFAPATQEQLTERLKRQLGKRFRVYDTPHYLVAHSTSREYARWLSSLLERLHKAFVNHWTRQGFDLKEPEFPLIVIVHATQAEYQQASAAEIGKGSGIVGYYSLKTNRVNMYDLTGVEQLRSRSGRRTKMREINALLRRPAASPLVSTIVHEATHQVAFNTGLMHRYADLPLWLVEGMAIYFEAPDLSSGRGWRGIGKVNRPRLETFQSNLPRWKADRLSKLIQDDRPLRDPATAADAYAEAWALNYFLMKQRPKEFQAYLGQMSKKLPFQHSSAEERLAEFQAHFGPVEDLSQAFLRYTTRIE